MKNQERKRIEFELFEIIKQEKDSIQWNTLVEKLVKWRDKEVANCAQFQHKEVLEEAMLITKTNKAPKTKLIEIQKILYVELTNTLRKELES